MQNQYLEVLELVPGATKAQVKSAYRRLSKIYHPDVSKEDNAREKFIEINEAYKFLTSVGPRPFSMEPSAPAYDYDVQNHAYDEWRRKAKAFAKKRAEDAARRQIELIRILLKGINVIVFLVLLLNLLLIIDFYRPEKTIEAFNYKEKRIIYKRTHKYTDVIFDNHTFRLKPGGISPSRHAKKILIHSTQILNVPLQLDVVYENYFDKYKPEYSIYVIFGYLIPMLLVMVFLYGIVFETLDNQLTMGIFILFLGTYQFYLFLKF